MMKEIKDLTEEELRLYERELMEELSRVRKSLNDKVRARLLFSAKEKAKSRE